MNEKNGFINILQMNFISLVNIKKMKDNEKLKVVIVGGGITGLSAAYTIQREALADHRPVSYTLIEAGEKLGGKIVTEYIDGLTIEGGPDCFIRQKPWASDLALQLGLGDEFIGTNDRQRKVWVLNKGKLAQLPDGVMLIVPTRIIPFVTTNLISWPGKVRMGFDLFIRPFSGDGDESVAAFVRRRLGNEALDKIAEPLLSGIHVSDPEQQSLLATFPRFRNIEKKHGSLIKGMLAERKNAAKARKAPQSPSKIPSSMFLTFKNGLGSFVAALEKQLTDGEIILGAGVTELDKMESGQYVVRLSDGREILADAVILTTPAYTAADLLREMAPDAASLTEKIRYVSTATISMAFRKRDIPSNITGHGLVIPKKEKRQIAACTLSSIKFSHRAPEHTLLLRCFIGGPGKEEQINLSDDQILDLARRELKAILSIDANPITWRVFRWKKANPQYDVDHIERVKKIRESISAHPGLYLAGSAYDGVGIPDCVHQGQSAAQMAIRYLSQLEDSAVKQEAY